MVGAMHIALSSVIISMHDERSIPPLGPTEPKIPWVYNFIIDMVDQEIITQYAKITHDAYYHMYERSSSLST